MSYVTLTKENFEQEVLRCDKPVLVDFWAAWCGPCQALAPTVEEIAAERSDVKVGKVNVDDQQELARTYRIMSIPTLMVFKNARWSAVRWAAGPRRKSWTWSGKWDLARGDPPGLHLSYENLGVFERLFFTNPEEWDIILHAVAMTGTARARRGGVV